MDLRGLN